MRKIVAGKSVKKITKKPRKIATKKAVERKTPRKSKPSSRPVLSASGRVLRRRAGLKKKSTAAVKLERAENNPIISPNKTNGWESWQTFNPGVVLLNDKVHFLYRAIGGDGVSRMGYAVSSDGLVIDERLDYPVYEHKTGERKFNIFSYFSGGSFGGVEDPRLTRVSDEDVVYMTYTACDNGLRVGLTSIKIDDFLNKKWKWRPPVLISPPDELHKNWVIFPEKINGKYAILHNIVPEIEVDYFDNLDFERNYFISSSRAFGPQKSHLGKKCWEKWFRGTGAPPLKTKHGWLLFYHAMDDDWSKYKVGAMLLDLNEPTKILHRAKEPVLEPEEFYENNGYKPGIVYVSGAAVKNGNLLVYYGASDNYVGVARANLEEFLSALMRDEKPRLSARRLKKRT